MDSGHWDISGVGEFDPEDFFGFIYLIEEKATGKGYIGKKFFRVKRRKTKADKTKTKVSGWQAYTSSSEFLNDLISEQGKDAFAFRILRLCSGRCELSYSEEEAQVTHDVLRARLENGERKYFNKTIGYKNFAGLEKQTDESNRKRSESQKGILKGPLSEETRAKMSVVRLGRKLSPEHCAAITAGKMGHGTTEEGRMNMSIAHIGHTASDETREKMSQRHKELGTKPPVNWGNRHGKLDTAAVI